MSQPMHDGTASFHTVRTLPIAISRISTSSVRLFSLLLGFGIHGIRRRDGLGEHQRDTQSYGHRDDARHGR